MSPMSLYFAQDLGLSELLQEFSLRNLSNQNVFHLEVLVTWVTWKEALLTQVLPKVDYGSGTRE